MGDQLSCTLHHNNKTSSGTALLETSELLFRGDTRLKIPFSAIKKIQARNGELHVHTADGLAIFALGPRADKWREKIANPKSLLEKLGVKSRDTVSLIGNFPADFRASLRKQGAEVVRKDSAKDPPWYFLAAESRQHLRQVKTLAAKSLRGAAALWIVYPKGRSSITESDVRSAGLKAGLTDVKVARFSDTHTALKFVIPKSKR